MLKRDRPWDKKRRGASGGSGGGPPHSQHPSKLAKLSTNDAVPFVEIGGAKFYSDRFYLNTTLVDHENSEDDHSFNAKSENGAERTSSGDGRCHCGANSPPPLFDRAALVQSLSGKLKAVIFGTYSFEVKTLQQEFPSLFGPTATTPCLVLHGKKGWKRSGKFKTTVEVCNDENDPESGPKHDYYSDCVEESKDDGCCSLSLGTQDEETMEMSKTFSSSTPVAKRSPPRPPVRTILTAPAALPETAHFSEISSTWLKAADIPSSFSAAVDSDTGFLRQVVRDKRLYKLGVHHPKFMILLEESGSIVVVVSTANFTSALSTDASWVQRFPAALAIDADKPATSPSSSTTKSNDFGTVLANFLQCQMLATASEQVTTHWFVTKYLGWKSLVDVERRFDYSSAVVQLVATVPGEYDDVDHRGGDSNKDKCVTSISTNGKYSDTMALPAATPSVPKRKELLYGQQRLSHCLAQLSLPPAVISGQDRLFIQPTSFGSEWNRRNMAHLVRSYLGPHETDDDPEACGDRSLLERLDIVWPTEHFVREANRHQSSGRTAGTTPTLANAESGVKSFAHSDSSQDEGDDNNIEVAKMNEGCLFLSSEIFNKIDLCCLNRMVLFEPSQPPQQPVVLSPHCKSVARVFRGSDYRIRKDYGVSKCEEYFSWFLLTSACLSRGAQGVPVTTARAAATVGASSDSERTKTAYSNFELGVLFSTCLGPPRLRAPKDRIYCWKPVQCTCATTAITRAGPPRLIHLPSPFSFRPARYVEDEDEAIMCETPYFHEIPPGTGCVGNMLLTPYGAALAAHFDKKALH